MAELAETTVAVCKLVSELTADERRRIFAAVAALCGDGPVETRGATSVADGEGFAKKTQLWLEQNGVPLSKLEEQFHIDGSDVELIAGELPGRSRREQVANCYLLLGIRNLLRTGEARIDDNEAVELCKRYKCYDVDNHSTYRRQAGSFLAGSKEAGFVLAAPGLRAAAALIKH